MDGWEGGKKRGWGRERGRAVGGWESRSPHKQSWKRSLSHLCHFTFGETESWWARRTQGETLAPVQAQSAGQMSRLPPYLCPIQTDTEAQGATEEGRGWGGVSTVRAPPWPHPLYLGRALCPPALGGQTTVCPESTPALPQPGQACPQRLGTSSSADPGAGAESMSPSPSLLPPLGQCQRQGHPGAPRGAEVPLMLPAERKRTQVW